MAVSPLTPLHIGALTLASPLLQAPMAGFTNYAYRQIMRRYGGVGLSATEMVSARGFAQIAARTQAWPERLWGVADEARPLAVQIWDNNPETLAFVGQRIARELRASVIDLNFGCPVRDVSQKAESGSYLLRYPDRVGEIVARVAAACAPTPVTAKIRLGCTQDAINAIDVAQAIEAAGGAAVAVHGRTAADLYRGKADWDQIAQIKPYLARIPLIGNGDLKTAEDVVAAFHRYGVDGVMIGRAALHRPWLFRQALAALQDEPPLPEPTWSERRQLLMDHYELLVAQYGPKKGTVLMRAHACCYAHGHPGARQFRSRVSRVATPAEFVALVEQEYPSS